ncbi:hypothetical protein [Streptosporangium sp. NPDC051022]
MAGYGPVVEPLRTPPAVTPVDGTRCRELRCQPGGLLTHDG